ncbi:MAG: hypothetical protein KUG77_29700 [Nannocystaceae bacterium]|nr:hypothetical protein [Nannocystaceae bacterium]
MIRFDLAALALLGAGGTRVLLGVVLLLQPACSSITEFGEESSTGEAGPTGTTTTGLLPSSTDPWGQSTTSGTIGPGAEEESSGDPSGCGGFICDPDGGPNEPIECSVIEQDCPRGQKCNAWANDGSPMWNAAKCFPIDRDPAAVGEPCTVVGSGVSGSDSCDLGSICWDVDARTEEGECLPYCTGTQNNPTCEDPSRLCTVSGDGVLPLCRPGCDPLDVESCADGKSCLGIDASFGCVPDASGDAGGVFETCEFANGCDPGLLCANAAIVGACTPEAGCCTPYCDLSAPMCPEPTTCVPYFAEGQATPGYETLGVCGSEETKP